tara:strand:+ start:7011 stop:7553 length:543 start_codon:yes stop_codon:yes gene_type:complete
MPYKNFVDYPLWKEGADLADAIFDFSRAIEDFPIRNRITGAGVEIPFLLGEAAQSVSDEQMRDILWKVEDPINELRSVLTEAKEQGFAPEADFEAMQERCRDLFQKVHSEASELSRKDIPVADTGAEESDPELAAEPMIKEAAEESKTISPTAAATPTPTPPKSASAPQQDNSAAPNNED